MIPIMTIMPMRGIFSNLPLIRNINTRASTVITRVRTLKLLNNWLSISKGLDRVDEADN